MVKNGLTLLSLDPYHSLTKKFKFVLMVTPPLYPLYSGHFNQLVRLSSTLSDFLQPTQDLARLSWTDCCELNTNSIIFYCLHLDESTSWGWGQICGNFCGLLSWTKVKDKLVTDEKSRGLWMYEPNFITSHPRVLVLVSCALLTKA